MGVKFLVRWLKPGKLAAPAPFLREERRRGNPDAEQYTKETEMSIPHGCLLDAAIYHLLAVNVKLGALLCQGKVEMSSPWQSRNVAFCLGFSGVRVNLLVPVKRRRALVATNPNEE